jgi:hypothetical protein
MIRNIVEKKETGYIDDKKTLRQIFEDDMKKQSKELPKYNSDEYKEMYEKWVNKVFKKLGK